MTETRVEFHAGDAGHQEDPVAEPLPQVMTIDQVASYLQVGKRTIYAMAAAGEIPAAKVGEQWRFFRPEIDRWLTRLSRQHIGEATPPRAADNGHL